MALDAALAAARDAQAQRQRTAAILDQVLLAARSSFAAASDFVATRRGAVGSEARTRLVEAQRHLEQAMALAERDPTQALREAQHADQLAQSDVDQWSSPYGPGRRGGYGRGGGLDLGSLVLGGILLGGGGGFGGGRGGFGGRSPGSFGGSGTRGRRGGGGRF